MCTHKHCHRNNVDDLGLSKQQFAKSVLLIYRGFDQLSLLHQVDIFSRFNSMLTRKMFLSSISQQYLLLAC